MRFRDARPDDHPLYVELFPDLGVDDPVPSTEVFADRIAPRAFVAERDGEAVGFSFIETLDDVGYVRQIMVVRAHRRGGVGRATMLEAARRMRAAGCETWCLNVRPANTAAVALYRSLGLEPQHRSAAVRLPWDRRDHLPDDPRLETEDVVPAEHAALEVRFGLLAGQLERMGSAPTQRRFVARRDGVPTGLAIFDPAFPGCFPFRADDGAGARALIEACVAHRPASSPWIQLVLEDSPWLVAAVVEAGAEIVLEFEHFRGPLP